MKRLEQRVPVLQFPYLRSEVDIQHSHCTFILGDSWNKEICFSLIRVKLALLRFLSLAELSSWPMPAGPLLVGSETRASVEFQTIMGSIIKPHLKDSRIHICNPHNALFLSCVSVEDAIEQEPPMENQNKTFREKVSDS